MNWNFTIEEPCGGCIECSGPPNPAEQRPQPNNRLSLAASAIYRMRTAEADPMGDPSGDCGDAIAAYYRSRELRAVLAAGYRTPGEYNGELYDRMVTPGEKMSLRVHEILQLTEVEGVCECGAMIQGTSSTT